MASFRMDGLDALETTFGNIAELPTSVIQEMLEAQGDVVVKAQKRTAQSMLRGRYYMGHVAASITKGRFKRTNDGGVLLIEFKGTQHGNRNTEVAFVNEYGKEGQPARPFVNVANETSAGETTAAGQKVMDNFIDRA